MEKVSFVAGKSFHGNAIFDRSQKKYVFGGLDKYYRLHDAFKNMGYEIATEDINKPIDSSIVLYFDMPKHLPKKNEIDKSYLLAIESSVVKPENFDTDKHQRFSKIFTWNDALVDGRKYIKLNYGFDLPKEIYKRLDREHLCCLISANKSSSYAGELYTERKNFALWCESNSPGDFHLYGFGWDELRSKNLKILKTLNRVALIKRILFSLFGKRMSVYKGVVENKFETMKKYKFVVAYENVKDELGYITEKIFDVFIAGCVPIYWGASNITNYVPENCFIDRRKFGSNSELYLFLKSMPDRLYMEYLERIEAYLNSDDAKQFRSETFAQTIVENCLSCAPLSNSASLEE